MSFEDRCAASLRALSDHDLKLSTAVLIEYPTVVRPSQEDRDRRAGNRVNVSALCGKICREKHATVTIDPYSFSSFSDALEIILRETGADVVVFDVTCMTKIHTLALASILSKPRSILWATAYTTPENYGDLNRVQKPFGWKDVIVAPLAETAALFNEAQGRGVILAGHEADRLIVALAELEPSGGVIVIAESRKRPDLRFVCERNNQKIIRQLTKMRASDWAKKRIGIEDVESLEELVRREASEARKHEAPVILFPFGPKSIVFLSGLVLCKAYPEASWFVYPMPSSYDVSYSEGSDRTFWMTGSAAPSIS